MWAGFAAGRLAGYGKFSQTGFNIRAIHIMIKKIGVPRFRKIWNSNFLNHICIALILLLKPVIAGGAG